METASEKKWFVYMVDHHEGPFSLDDIKQKLTDGAVSKEQFCWAEGMQDWKPMPEIPEFEVLFAPPPPPPPAPAAPPGPPPSPISAGPNHHSLIAGDVAIAAVDREGLPALDVPLQMMMEQSLSNMDSVQMVTPEPPGSGPGSGPILMEERTPPPVKRAPALQAPAPSPAFTPVKAEPSSYTDLNEKPTGLSSIGKEEFTGSSKQVPASPSDERTPVNKKNKDKLVAPKAGALTRENIALVQEGPVIKGGTSAFKKILKLSLKLGVIGGLVYAYTQGHLDPIIKNPALRDGVSKGFEKAKELAEPGLAFLVEKVPALAPFISTFPKVSDVATADYEDLKTAATTSISSVGPAVSVAWMTGDPKNLQFYTSTNLPDGAVLVVHLEGVAETLLNATDFTKKVNVTIAKHLGKSAPITQEDGSQIPRGDYKVYVYEAEQQPANVKLILDQAKSTAGDKLPRVLAAGKKSGANKKYFLGGTRDKVYEDRLKEYHANARVRAQQDYEELYQNVATLTEQLNKSYSLMKSLREKASKVKSGKGSKSALRAIEKEWSSGSSKWRSFQAQFNKFEKWTPEYLKSCFYPNIYAHVRRIAESLMQFHQAQEAFFEKPTDAALGTKLDESQKLSQELLTEISPKVRKIQEVLSKPDGVPVRVD